VVVSISLGLHCCYWGNSLCLYRPKKAIFIGIMFLFWQLSFMLCVCVCVLNQGSWAC
jgi:hypothetical protein